MAKRYARKSTRKYSRRRSRSRARRGRRSGSGFSKRVLAVVRKTRELKIARRSGSIKLTSDILGPDAVSVGNLAGFFPNLPQSISRRGRVGSEITARKLTVKFWCQFVPNVEGVVGVDQGNVTGRVWLLKQKNIASSVNLINNIPLAPPGGGTQGPYFRSDQLLEIAGGTQGFASANTYTNIMSPINRELFGTTMEKKMNLKSLIFTNAQGTSGVTSIVEAPSNFKKWTKTFNWKNGKKFNYRESTSLLPNDWPWAITGGYVNTNGSVPGAGGVLQLFFSSTLRYTDA